MASDRIERRLAAIMFTDIVGYTARGERGDGPAGARAGTESSCGRWSRSTTTEKEWCWALDALAKVTVQDLDEVYDERSSGPG